MHSGLIWYIFRACAISYYRIVCGMEFIAVYVYYVSIRCSVKSHMSENSSRLWKDQRIICVKKVHSEKKKYVKRYSNDEHILLKYV